MKYILIKIITIILFLFSNLSKTNGQIYKFQKDFCIVNDSTFYANPIDGYSNSELRINALVKIFNYKKKIQYKSATKDYWNSLFLNFDEYGIEVQTNISNKKLPINPTIVKFTFNYNCAKKSKFKHGLFLMDQFLDSNTTFYDIVSNKVLKLFIDEPLYNSMIDRIVKGAQKEPDALFLNIYGRYYILIEFKIHSLKIESIVIGLR